MALWISHAATVVAVAVAGSAPVACEPAGATDQGQAHDAGAGAVGSPKSDAQSERTTEKVTLKGPKGERTVALRLAIDDASRTKGLGDVTSLAPDEGMIFVFPDSRLRAFWMKDCVIDIDIAYLDPFGIVTEVVTMPKEAPRGQNESMFAYESRLPRYSSRSPAQFAIEVAPGTFDTLGITRGSKIDLDLKKLKGWAK